MRIVQRLLVVAGLLVGVVGCNGEDNLAVLPPTPGPSNVATVTVGPNGTVAFSPQQVAIAVGGTVTWIWQAGSLLHTVTSGVPGAPNGLFCNIPPSQTPSVQTCSGSAYAVMGPTTFSHTFTTVGTFPYFCQVHGPAETGSVVVVAAAAPVPDAAVPPNAGM
jgi:plastocyanin